MFQTTLSTFLRKRRQPELTCAQPQKEMKFREVTVYLVERRMGKSRRNFLTSLARSKGFSVDNTLSSKVTHIVAEDNPAHELWPWLQEQGIADLGKMNVLDIAWFTQSMKAGRPIPVEAQHRIQKPSVQPKPEAGPPNSPWLTVSQYACQRRTTLYNHNKILTDALEVLAENYEFIESIGPCLGFRRAASMLKSLPAPLRNINDTEGLPCLGPETKAVIQDIFECGSSSKVEEVLTDERYRTLKIFTSVFGVGPKTAEKWYRKGLRSLEQIASDSSIHLNKMQIAGFQYYEDISKPVSKAEAEAVGHIIKEIAGCFSPDVTMTLTGGFRRGKEFGHDVDFLLTVPRPGKEDGLLPAVINQLRTQGLLLYSDFQESTFDLSSLPNRRFEAMDHFQKCFLIVKLKKDQVVGQQAEQRCGRDWKAVRVDLVAPPAERYAFALLGWSGSTQFERDLRRFSRLERNMLLDNHALFDKTTNTFLQAKTEEDIFTHLGLDYIEPWQRNA
ncbi:DNA nucleotidylexotransferase [Ictalurus punctatus]|uniref:DNA nucleotidylexotransferase n=1 Tax=Ictalurus punctatus TaxID=7998 RepID=W5U8U3_ICTPU|nr:DNA nucleotidylexotransferase [Ictalurus punctatus]